MLYFCHFSVLIICICGFRNVGKLLKKKCVFLKNVSQLSYSLSYFLSVDELRKLLSDKDAYNQFLLSVDQVKIQNNVSSKNCPMFLISPFQSEKFACCLSF